jgi:endo-1,4-beta-xylanase
MTRREWLGGAMLASVGLDGFAQMQPVQGLRELASQSGRLFGFAVSPDYAGTEPVKSLLLAHAGVITAENAMKWRNIESFLGNPDYQKADQIAALAAEMNVPLRGHTLAWHQSTPARLSVASKAEFARAQTLHLQSLVGRYLGRIHTWDVLNEAIEVDTTSGNEMRESVLSGLWGADRYPELFELARNADPHAKLAYNDYGMEQDEPWCERRRNAALRMLEKWVRRGTPIDAVGLQAHLNLSRKFSATLLARFLDELQGLGLSVQITELDVSDPESQDVAARDAGIAALYRDFVQTCVAHPAVEMIVMWNVTDRDTWLNRWMQAPRRADGQPYRPTLFDEAGRPKQAFQSVATALRDTHVGFDLRKTRQP